MKRPASKIRRIGWRVAFLFIAACLAGPALAQQERMEGKNALEYVRALTQERFASRDAGFEGGRLAGDYIAARFKAWGLEPAGTDGYFQDFKKPVFHVDAAELTISGEKWMRTLNYDEEWRVAQHSGSAEVRGELVFAGYGICSEKAGWNDFAGLDLKGKVVVFIQYGAPEFLAGKLGPEETMPGAKLARAYELGARAALLLNEPVDVRSMFNSYPHAAYVMLESSNTNPGLAVAGLNADAAKAIFRDSGIDLYTRVQKLRKDQKPVSMPLGIMADLKVKTSDDPQASPRNVLARITGSDPVLKNEYIIIGAHYDHLGDQPDGRLNPGADDNASGTSVIMELARVMKAGKARPKRTVIFALWDGEEQGLWGSVYYCAHPIYPLNRTIINLNLDMVGHGDGGLQFRGAYYGPAIWDLLQKTLPAEALKGVVPTRGGPGGSDHTPFLAAGIPAFFIQTTGPHFGRHDVGDKFDLVDPVLLERSGVFVKAVVDVLADDRSLKAEPAAREINLLRSSSLVDLKPRRISDLLKEAETVEYPDLDFALVGLEGGTPLELVKSLVDTTTAVKGSKKAILYEPPVGYNRQTYGARFGVLPGITDLAALAGRDDLLKIMGKAGLGFITIKDEDIARNEEETRRIMTAANEIGVLVIARVQPSNIGRVLEWSRRPGILVGDAPDDELTRKLKEHGWRLALDWQDGLTPEAYAGMYRQTTKTLGPMSVLAQAKYYGLQGFSPSLVRLASMLAPEELSERQVMTGGLDDFGQNFIQLLWMVAPRSNDNN